MLYTMSLLPILIRGRKVVGRKYRGVSAPSLTGKLNPYPEGAVVGPHVDAVYDVTIAYSNTG